MAEIIDIIVLGLGANGSSALYHLSKTNKKILGIDRFTPPHSFGSSHGESRIIRQAYHESPVYVPFVLEAYNLWDEIEALAGEKLLLKTGGIMLGTEDASVILGAKLSAGSYGIAYDYLNYKDLKQQFPAFKPSEDTVAVVEKNAGILFPEKCIKAYLTQAQKNGAGVRFNETVLTINPKADYVEIITSKGTYLTEKLIISAGAWTSGLLPGLALPLRVERQVAHWFRNTNPQMQPYAMPDKLPIYIWEFSPGKMFYGFPDLGDGLKIAHHHDGDTIDPGNLKQDATPDEVATMKNVLDTYFNFNVVHNYSGVCMFTNTPDADFIVDYHPQNKNIVIASPCSGHGFKFSSLTGKLLGDMALDKKLDFDISPFRIAREYV
jgi:sarcosine oxidase